MRSVLAALLLVAMLPARSYADANIDPRIQYSIETISPSLSGFSVLIYPPITVHFPPQVVVDNLSHVDVTVLDITNKPMLRVGPGGTYMNAASAKAQSALDPSGAAGIHPTLKGAHPSVVWRKLSNTHQLTWYETRAMYGALGPRNPRLPAPLKAFHIAMLAGGHRLNVDGLVSWSPILGSIAPVIVSINPATSGVHAIAQKGVTPAIELTNSSRSTIEITGSDGHPFAKVGPSGVDENVNSPQYRDTKLLSPSFSHTVRWEHEQSSGVLLWLDKRLIAKEPPFEEQQKSQTIDLGRWTIPGTISGKPFSINGVNRWTAYQVPTPHAATQATKAFPWAAVVGGIALGAGFGIMGVALTRRRTAKAPT